MTPTRDARQNMMTLGLNRTGLCIRSTWKSHAAHLYFVKFRLATLRTFETCNFRLWKHLCILPTPGFILCRFFPLRLVPCLAQDKPLAEGNVPKAGVEVLKPAAAHTPALSGHGTRCHSGRTFKSDHWIHIRLSDRGLAPRALTVSSSCATRS